MEAFAGGRRVGVDHDEGEDAIAEGLAMALQCFQDGMGEKLASLAKEQAELLAKLEASREASDCLSYVLLYVTLVLRRFSLRYLLRHCRFEEWMEWM